MEKMGCLGLSMKGIFLAIFLFIGVSMLSSANINLLNPEFLSIGGFLVLLSICLIEANFVFYE